MNALLTFLNDIKANGGCFFIEAEAKTKRIENFIYDYNNQYSPKINMHSDGIIVLKEDANKWGLELRLYVPITPPENMQGFAKNDTYKGEYSYRLNDNQIIQRLFNNGCRIGLN